MDDVSVFTYGTECQAGLAHSIRQTVFTVWACPLDLMQQFLL